MKRKLLHEIFIAARFAFVGVGATLIHMSLAFVLISSAALHALLANTIAFCGAFGISFAGHYFWTFQSPGSPKSAMRRFFIISATAFTVNTIVLSALLHSGCLAPLLSTLVSAAAIPAITFMASRFWGFKHKVFQKGTL